MWRNRYIPQTKQFFHNTPTFRLVVHAITLCASIITPQKLKQQSFGDLTIRFSVFDLGAVQTEHFTWQHRIMLQVPMCLAHCLCSLSTLRCGVEKSLRTTNETVFPSRINLSISSARQNTLCSADDATMAETAAVRRLNICIYTYTP